MPRLNVKDLIREQKVDLVHENTSGSFMAAYAAIVTGTPFIWHMREFNKEDHQQRFRESLDPYDAFSKADACICISKAIEEKYSAINDRGGKTVLIYDGIDERVFPKR